MTSGRDTDRKKISPELLLYLLLSIIYLTVIDPVYGFILRLVVCRHWSGSSGLLLGTLLFGVCRS